MGSTVVSASGSERGRAGQGLPSRCGLPSADRSGPRTALSVIMGRLLLHIRPGHFGERRGLGPGQEASSQGHRGHEGTVPAGRDVGRPWPCPVVGGIVTDVRFLQPGSYRLTGHEAGRSERSQYPDIKRKGGSPDRPQSQPVSHHPRAWARATDYGDGAQVHTAASSTGLSTSQRSACVERRTGLWTVLRLAFMLWSLKPVSHPARVRLRGGLRGGSRQPGSPARTAALKRYHQITSSQFIALTI